MKRIYEEPTYVINFFTRHFILTISSDRENAYVPSDSLWEDFEFDDDDD